MGSTVTGLSEKQGVQGHPMPSAQQSFPQAARALGKTLPTSASDLFKSKVPEKGLASLPGLA